MTRREKLSEIFDKVGTRSFASYARKNGLNVPYSNEIEGTSLGTFLSDSISCGWLYDEPSDNEWINEWYDKVFKS